MNSFQPSTTPTSNTDLAHQRNVGGSAGSLNTNTTRPESDTGISGSAPTLTFTPSGAAGSHVSSFRNVKTAGKSLAYNVEASLADALKDDADFIEGFLRLGEKSADSKLANNGVQEEKPSVEDSGLSDAEAFAYLQARATLDGFRQTAQQAVATARFLPSTASSHLDAELELPQNLDNPTLNDIQQIASEQVRFIQRQRKYITDCIEAMRKSVEEPTEDEIIDFLQHTDTTKMY
ncbi:hypothetical protein RvY_09918 [Ramazzottius varieornatus]|uniref:Uncharacterized protein n=1 Tax=Ramazzottius varieornatus TaxID=947166 RepID=A0A1D1VK06_RAMVA|nr:hypothetical protein RvY_09918 [Ramazzottius varieornatus]